LDKGRAGLGLTFSPWACLGSGAGLNYTDMVWAWSPGGFFFSHGTLRIAKLLACLLFVPKKNEALFSTDLAHPNPRAVRALRKKINFAKHTKEK